MLTGDGGTLWRSEGGFIGESGGFVKSRSGEICVEVVCRWLLKNMLEFEVK